MNYLNMILNKENIPIESYENPLKKSQKYSISSSFINNKTNLNDINLYYMLSNKEIRIKNKIFNKNLNMIININGFILII